MRAYSEEERASALRVVSSTIEGCEKALLKFQAGTSQHTLLKNRIRALCISKTLMADKNGMVHYDNEELEEALKPIASIIGKCEKAQVKFSEGTAHHTRFRNLIRAMQISRALILEAIDKKS